MFTQEGLKCEYCGSRKDVSTYEFKGVLGIIIYSWRDSVYETFCEKHKMRRLPSAIFLTLTCLTIGWWSIPAIIWNIPALITNIRGGDVILSNKGFPQEELDIPEDVLRAKVLDLLRDRNSSDFNLRLKALSEIRKIGRPAAPIIIEKLQESKDKDEIRSNMFLLSDLDDERAIPVIMQISQEHDKRAVRKSAKEYYKEMEKRKKRRDK